MNATDLIAAPFVQRAFLAAILLALCGGVLSFFVVERRLAFMGHGIAHSMVAGVALGLLMGWPVLWPALAVALAVSFAIGWASRSGSLPEDSAIGIALSASLAIGLLLVSLKRGYISHLESYLFGSILAVTSVDLMVIGTLALLYVAVVIRYWRVLLFFTYDPEGAAIAGYPVQGLRYGMLAALALLIAVSMKIVGILLVGAFLVIPAAAAVYWTARAERVVLLSLLFSLVSALLGMSASVLLNASAGATIVLALVFMFLFSRLLGPYRG
jgi:zinc transport system permease protein